METFRTIASLVVGTLISEDLTCITAGQLSATGMISLRVALVGCFVGIYLGDLGLWLIGWLAARGAMRWNWLRRLIDSRRGRELGAWFDRNAAAAMFASRFMPGTRLPLYLAAGALGRSGTRFALWTFIATAIWTPTIVLLVYTFGNGILAIARNVFSQGAGLLIAIALGFISLRGLIHLTSPLNRAKLAAKLARWRRWEFWPMWLFYPPVLLWIGWLALRHRGFGAIAAANPGIPAGGFVGESKFQILFSLKSPHVIRTIRIARGEKFGAAIDSALAALSSDGSAGASPSTLGGARDPFPVILKPDVGQRGAGVRFARSREEAISILRDSPTDMLIQPFHPGPFEAGIFYYRLPHESSGRIFSITDKIFPQLRGDGRSTLEELIYAHPRYRLQAGTFLKRHADERDRVLNNGEQFQLALAGNHCQGTMFRDGAHLITPALTDAIDRIARTFDGFHFGRFDVRYSDVNRFCAGEDFAIIELNGVTSESTNVYDPSWSLWRAYRQLFAQWSILFQIGAANRDLSRASGSLGELIRAWWSDTRSRRPSALSD